MELPDILADVPVGLHPRLTDYFEQLRIPSSAVLPADIVLALLRINTKEALRAAEVIVGKPIQRCPEYSPPWPPKPVARSQGVVLKRRDRNPCLPTTDAFQRYRQLRVGMTREQILNRGVQVRDLTRWTRLGHIEFGSRA